MKQAQIYRSINSMFLQFGVRIHYRSSVYKVMALMRLHKIVQESLPLQLSVASKFRGHINMWFIRDLSRFCELREG